MSWKKIITKYKKYTHFFEFFLKLWAHMSFEADIIIAANVRGIAFGCNGNKSPSQMLSKTKIAHVDAFCWLKASFAAVLESALANMRPERREQIYVSANGQNRKICCECDREKQHISWDSKVVWLILSAVKLLLHRQVIDEADQQTEKSIFCAARWNIANGIGR